MAKRKSKKRRGGHHKYNVRQVRKLTDGQIDRMRSEGRSKGKRQKGLAKKYGVSQAFVSKVLAAKSRRTRHKGRKNIPSRR